MVHCGQDAGIGIGRGPKVASSEMVDHRLDLVGDHGAGHGASGPGFEIGEQRDRLFAVEGAFDGIAADYERLFKDRAVMADYIHRSLAIKKHYIEEDEFDLGPRNVFNYGHSFGHAIEAATSFAIPHGIAVTIGMDMANFAAVRIGIGTDEHFHRMHPTLKGNYLGFEDHPISTGPFLDAIAKDKKNTGSGTVALILPDAGGRLSKGSFANDDAFAAVCADYLEQERAL